MLFSIGGCLHLKDLQNMVCSYMLKYRIGQWSYKRLLRYSTFNILRSSSMRGRLHLKNLNTLLWSPKKFKIWIRSGQWLLRYSTFNILRLSSNGGRLHFKHFFVFVWSPELKFKMWGRSNQWLLRYFIFLSRLTLKFVFISFNIQLWIGPLSLS